jgi:hypothetical protein
VHYTPKHGSWLNQAKIAISLLSRQCLGQRRIGDRASLRRQVQAWSRRMNHRRTPIQWRSTRKKARRTFNFNHTVTVLVLVSKKDASGTWGTTQATIMALRALLTATEKGAADVRGTATILLNGKPEETLVLSSESNDLYHQFVFKAVEQGKTNTVEIRFDGKGALTYQVVGGYGPTLTM